MITREEACALVLQQVNERSDGLELVVTHVEERPLGWLISYNTKRYYEAGNMDQALAGNLPYLVCAADGAMQTIHYFPSFAECLREAEDELERHLAAHDSTAACRVSEPGFWEELHKKFDAARRSIIVIHGDASLRISNFRVYIDRNIQMTGARFAHLAPANGIYTRHPAGLRTAIVRECDVHKPDRLESNLLEFESHDDEQVTLLVSMRTGRLEISLEGRSRHLQPGS